MSIKKYIFVILGILTGFIFLTVTSFCMIEYLNNTKNFLLSKKNKVESITEEYGSDISNGITFDLEHALSKFLYDNEIRSLKLINNINDTKKIVRPIFPLGYSQNEVNCIGEGNLTIFNVLFLNCYKQRQVIYFGDQSRVMYELTWNINTQKNDFDFFLLVKKTLILMTFSIFTLLFLLVWLKGKLSNPLVEFTDLLSRGDLELIKKVDKRTYKRLPKEIQDLISSISSMANNIEKLNKEKLSVAKEQVKYDMARQVAHDIRSPLTALQMISDSLKTDDKSNKTIFRSSINRIRDIANNLLNQNKLNISKLGVWLLYPVIEEIIFEKRTALRNFPEIKIFFKVDNLYGQFASFDQSLLKRIISNIINNSVESFAQKKGMIHIELVENEKYELVISDNGIGIPENILNQIGNKEITYGKENHQSAGSGIALYQARKHIDSWGGELEILSLVNIGTTVKIKFPKEKSPSWFVDEVILNRDHKFVIVDDDDSIHQAWEKRLRPFAELNTIHFYDPEVALNWIKDNDGQAVTYFLDYEFLSHTINGIDLINEIKCNKNTYLITGRYEETEIVSFCKENSIKLIPKPMLAMVPLRSSKKNAISDQEIDLVLLDDCELVRMSWNLKAKSSGKLIDTYAKPDQLIENIHLYSKNTAFYIDSCLGSEFQSGEYYAKKLNELGFNNLHIATGFEDLEFKNLKFIKSIVGKEFPLSD